MRALSHDLKNVLPLAIQINRGKLSQEEVVEYARILGADRTVILHRWKGGPGRIELNILGSTEELSFPIIYLASTKHQKELQGRILVKDSLALVRPETECKELKQLSEVLSKFLNAPLIKKEKAKELSKVGMVFDKVDSRMIVTFKSLSDNTEIGPRLVIKYLLWSNKMSRLVNGRSLS